MDDFKGCNTLVEELTTDVVEIARELELEVEPEIVTESLLSHDRTLMMKSCCFWMSKDSGFLRWN